MYSYPDLGNQVFKTKFKNHCSIETGLKYGGRVGNEIHPNLIDNILILILKSDLRW
jgi:hypothetical protein